MDLFENFSCCSQWTKQHKNYNLKLLCLLHTHKKTKIFFYIDFPGRFSIWWKVSMRHKRLQILSAFQPCASFCFSTYRCWDNHGLLDPLWKWAISGRFSNFKVFPNQGTDMNSHTKFQTITSMSGGFEPTDDFCLIAVGIPPLKTIWSKEPAFLGKYQFFQAPDDTNRSGVKFRPSKTCRVPLLTEFYSGGCSYPLPEGRKFQKFMAT